MNCNEPATPWQRVYAKFGMSQSEFARALKRHRAKISRALSDTEGLINGRDQKLILAAAKQHNVRLDAADMMPREA